MTVAIAPSYSPWYAEVEHRTSDASVATVDASTGTRFHDIPIREASRLLRWSGAPVNGNGASGEFHFIRKITKPYGTWRTIRGTIAEALSAAELTGVALGGEGYAARDGISVGTILRITGVVAADTPDRVIVMVVRVTAVTLAAGSSDTIDFEHIWNSISYACDTGATLEVYDRTVIDSSHLSEDIWRDLNIIVDEAIDSGAETALTLAAEGYAATAGIVAGSVLKAVGVLAAAAVTEYYLVTSITLAGGQADIVNVIRAYWGSTATAMDTGALLYRLEGEVGAGKSLSGVNDNVYYEMTELDDDFADFGPHDVLRSIVAGTAEVRVRFMFAPYKGAHN